MVSTLQELCYQKLASTMNDAPPLLQEMIMGETQEYFKNQIRSEVKKEIQEEQKEIAYNDIMETVPVLVPEIMADILASMTQNGRMRQDFRMIYAHLSPQDICRAPAGALQISSLNDAYSDDSLFASSDDENNND